MNPQQELFNHVNSLLSQLEEQELSNNSEIERKDQIIDTLQIDVECLCNDLDDVRMMYCSLLATYSATLGVKQSAEQIAKSLGWSCYDRGYQ